MIIRTYQRRNRAAGSVSESSESFWSSSHDSPWASSQEGFSSQESTGWSQQLELELENKSMLGDPVLKKQKQDDQADDKQGNTEDNSARNSLCRKIGLSLNRRWCFSAPPTSTLMEAQESGEMMEQVDEINFALDGLRDGQNLGVQRGSVLAILSLCDSAQRRRFLKSHGITKPLVEALATLPTDDPPLMLASAAVLYLLACDGRDADLLDTSTCVGFLLKLVEKSNDISGSDGMDVEAKVASVFSKLKERRAQLDDYPGGGDLSARALALRTLEKACLSAVALDDNTGAVTKVGGLFKERLRQMGGLDTICNVAVRCLKGLADGEANMKLLLKCLRVMENVTFLSEHNQSYLLNMKITDKELSTPLTFIGLVVRTIRTLQDSFGDGKAASRMGGEEVEVETLKSHRDNRAEFPSCSQTKSLISSKGCSIAISSKELKLRSGLQRAKLLNSQRKSTLTSNCRRVVQVKVSKREDISGKRNGATNPDPFDFDDMEDEVQVKAAGIKRPRDTVTSPPDASLVSECLLSAVKVLMNLTNDNALGCQQVSECNGISSVAGLLVASCSGGQTDQTSDVLVAVLGMLVNLVEKDKSNRAQLADLDISLPPTLDVTPAPGRGMIALLCSLFLSKQGSCEAAETMEGSTPTEEDIKKGQREAENMIVEAYAALVLAFLCTDSEQSRQAVAARLGDKGLQALVPVLDRFLAFHLSLNMVSPETHAAVTDVINSLKRNC